MAFTQTQAWTSGSIAANVGSTGFNPSFAGTGAELLVAAVIVDTSNSCSGASFALHTNLQNGASYVAPAANGYILIIAWGVWNGPASSPTITLSYTGGNTGTTGGKIQTAIFTGYATGILSSPGPSASASGTVSPASVSISGVGTGDLVVAIMNNTGAHNFSAGSGYTLIFNTSAWSGNVTGMEQTTGLSEPGGTANVSTTFTSANWNMLAADFPVAGAAPSNTGQGAPLGVLGPGAGAGGLGVAAAAAGGPFTDLQFTSVVRGYTIPAQLPVTAGLKGILASSFVGNISDMLAVPMTGVVAASLTGLITAFITNPTPFFTPCVCFATSSGRVSQTVYQTQQLIDEAYAACKIRPQQIGDEMIDRGLRNLYLIMSSMVNIGTPIWTYDKQLLTMNQGTAGLAVPPGTVDIRNAYLRTLNPLTSDPGTPTFGTSSVAWSFLTSSPTPINTISLTWSGTPVPLIAQYSNVSPTGPWTTAVQLPVPPQANGPGTYWYDLDGVVAATYWQLIPVTASAVLTVTGASLGTIASDILMGRLNQDDYTTLPNKAFPGRPLQYWFDRQIAPVMRLWPAPDQTSATFPVVIYRGRYMQDVGSLTQTIEMPQYWYDAITWRLAVYLCVKTPEADITRLPFLKTMNKETWDLAWNQDRDRAPVRLEYNLRAYTS